MLRVVVVDDEAPARKELARLVDAAGDAEVVARIGNPSEVVPTLEGLACDLVLLDIQMPGMTGLEVASEVRAMPDPPAIAFVTAYDEFALEAFEREAVDYILKPADPARVARVLERVRAGTGGAPSDLDRLARLVAPRAPAPLVGARPGSDRKVLVRPARLLYVEARDEVVLLVTPQGEYMASRTLKDLEAELAPQGFERVHRSYLVNMAAVREFEPEGGGGAVLYLEPAPFQVPVSRRAWAALRPRLEAGATS
jgi:DNA-binding LytR/AlgR family response regulator